MTRPIPRRRGLARQAGVHFHNDRDDRLYEMRSFPTLAVVQAGPRTIKFRRPESVFVVLAGEQLGQAVFRMGCDLRAKETLRQRLA